MLFTFSLFSVFKFQDTFRVRIFRFGASDVVRWSEYVCASRAGKESQMFCLCSLSTPSLCTDTLCPCILGYFIHKWDAQNHYGCAQLLKNKNFYVFNIPTPNFHLWKSLMYPKPKCWTYTASKQLRILASGKSQ